MSVFNLSKINKDEFNIVSKDGLNLIFPQKNKWNWKSEERWFRSIILDDDGKIVSCSFPKFGNFGEFLNDTETLKNDLKNNSLVKWTHKEDGTLCVRSVINGKVVLRTRGTMYGETYYERFKQIAEVKYPKILDCNWVPDITLLFEYISPDNMIVVRHKEDDLIFLGAVNHNPSIVVWENVEKIAVDGKLRLVELKCLPNNTMDLLNEVKEWRTEGVVARCCNDQVFVKIKSAWYLANHRMKYSMNYNTIVEFIYDAEIKDEKMLVDKLRECEYDFEIIEGAKEFYKQYTIAKEIIDGDVVVAKNIIASINLDGLSETERRKSFAKVACSQPGFIKSVMFCLYDGKTDSVNSLIKKSLLSGDK
jgi:hypothetical protein